MRIAHGRFLSDTTHCPTMASKSVCAATVPGTERVGQKDRKKRQEGLKKISRVVGRTVDETDRQRLKAIDR